MPFVFYPSVFNIMERFIPRRYIQQIATPPGRSLRMLFTCVNHHSAKSLLDYQKEILGNIPLRERFLFVMRKGWFVSKYGSWEGIYGDLFRSSANISWFYAMIRELKPKRVIETGTAAGIMTSLILAALEANGAGELVSIDLPAVKGKNTMNWSLPQGQEAGLLIPDEYKNRWELRTGDAKDLFVPALREKPCDIFIHDSLHTYEHMLWEYVTALVNMDDGKIIISDDTKWNRAWLDFTSCFQLPRFHDLANPGVGVTIVRHKTP